jgi:FtsP/CotA-like multicopper oxidase with cupredoxin domain
LPACGTQAPQDAVGQGTLQLTRPAKSRAGTALYNVALPTENGLQITFTDYAFDGSTPGGDGVMFFLTDASQPLPTAPGPLGGSLGYFSTATAAGLANAYIGVALDEFGGFSLGLGGPGIIAETIAARGAASIGYEYLGGYTNAAITAASLPFAFDTPTLTTRPATAPTVRATLMPSGTLSVAIDTHNGAGFVTYYSQAIVGVNGQPAVPARVYFGLAATTGNSSNAHQISDLVINSIPIQSAADNPPEIVSQNGSLNFNVTAQADVVTGNPEFVYNGSTVPPTLRLLPGDTLNVKYTNDLPTPPAGAGYTNNTNLHYHGLHVSPQAPSDDSIDLLAAPGQTLQYSIKIPLNHPPGLYWYHTHAHAETERQTLAGMSGALIIDGIAAYTPQVANLLERVLIARDAPLPGTILPNADATQVYAMRWAMQHGVAMHGGGAATGATGTTPANAKAQFHANSTMQSRNPYAPVDPKYRQFIRSQATDTHCVAGSPEAPVKALTLNGVSQPVLRIAPGEQQFWRMVNAGADTYLNVSVDNTSLQIIGIDGVPISSGVGTPASLTVNNWTLPPASRVEFIITGPPAGTAYLRTNCFDSGPTGEPMPDQILASINAAAAPALTPALVAKRLAAVGRIAPQAARFRFHTTATLRSHAAIDRAKGSSTARPIQPKQVTAGPTAAQRQAAARLRAATITATRTIYYTGQYNINGIAYDPAAPPQFYSQVGSVEEWTIVNNDTQVHTFHIHQVHFLVEAVNGVTQSQQYLMDNVNVPAATDSGPGSVTVLLDFTDPTIIGTFLLHCHILSHEDAGMMAQIRIGTAPPLTLSAANVTFATPSSGAQNVTIGGGTAPYSVTGCTGVADAAVSAGSITLLPAASGSCVLTIADSSAPNITATLLVQVSTPPPSINLAPATLSFVSPTAAAQNLVISGGLPPYTVTGCSGIVSIATSGGAVAITPQTVGTCSLAISDSADGQTTLPVSVNAAVVISSPLDNLTYHQNAMRTGWYQNETTLNASNVNSSTFGQVATLAAPAGYPALGKVYAQPLFAANELAVDGNLHNLVIVAGAAGRVYAFDESTQAVVWYRDFTNAAAGIRQQVFSDNGCPDTNPDIGIIGTPTIDRTLDAIYVVVATMENGAPYLRLHAIGLGNGTDLVAPAVISGSVTLATGGLAAISPIHNMNRSGLLEANGNIYVALGSHCDAASSTTHGWILAYNAATLAQVGSLADTSNAGDGTGFFLGSPWMGGFGPAADLQGNIYFATGNGPFNGTTDFSMSVLEAPGNLNLAGAQYFTPIQEAADSAADLDLGSGGVVLLPDQASTPTHLAIAGGKCSSSGCYKYLLNRDLLGGQQAQNAGALWTGSTGGGIWGGPAYFVDSSGQQHIVWGGNPLNTYNLNLAPLSLTVASSTNVGCLECRDNGSQPVVSSNGTTAGTAIVWALKTPGNPGGPITLYAFNPFAMGTPLYSATAGSWTIGAGASYIGGALVSPTVADGRVYVPTDGSVSVFGLTSQNAAARRRR